MASACVNNNVSVSQEFSTPYGCFNPRASSSSSFSREDVNNRSSKSAVSEMNKKHIPANTEIYGCFNPRDSGSNSSETTTTTTKKKNIPTSATEIGGDFEFSLVDPVGMLPADELFSDGKLVTTTKTEKQQQQQQTTVEIAGKSRKTEIESETTEIEIEITSSSSTFSPKAPKCSSRWREILGLKRFNKSTTNPKSIKQLLNRTSRSSSSTDASLLSLPLLDHHESSSSSSSSSRMSLSSSSSSSHDHDQLQDLPRLSLDANLTTTTANPFAPSRSQNQPPRMRLLNQRTGRCEERNTTTQTMMMNRGVSVDSPRLNSSGKIVFQSLERSSSSPSSFNNGTSGYRHRGMERSYSSNVRVTPVLNVPTIRFFSSSSSSNRVGHGTSINRGRNSTDRV